MSEDSLLKEAVLAELKWEPRVNEAHIGVTAKGGVVALIGHVENYAEKHAAELAACRVKGVKAIAEELEVRLPFELIRRDEEIAAASIERIAWNVAIPRHAVKVKVENGWVTLSGEVDWNYQREAAQDDIRWLSGVLGVSNQVNIKPQPNSLNNSLNISDKISHALHRSGCFDPRTILVSAYGGAIKLTGTVHSWLDRDVAVMTAWSAPGVTSVENEIRIV